MRSADQHGDPGHQGRDDAHHVEHPPHLTAEFVSQAHQE